MAKLSIEDRIAQLDARKKSLQAKLGKQERARDTRRKILLGALVLDRLSSGQAGRKEESPGVHIQGSLTDWIKRELAGFLTRDDDKALFPEFITVNSKNDGQTATTMSSDQTDASLSGSTPSGDHDNARGSASVTSHS